MRFIAASLDLSKLPAPDVVREIDYEKILSERIAGVSTRLNDAGISFDTGNLDGDPIAIVEQEDAFREMLDLQAINDAARARMLAFARGSDLDHLGAFYGVKRLLLDAGDLTAYPPRQPVYEDHDSYRARIQIAPDAYSHGGTFGSYVYLSMQAAPELSWARPIKRKGGHVDIVLLARDGDGSAPFEVVDRVARVFAAEDGAPLTDIVSVRSAKVVPYKIDVTLRVPHGPDLSIIQARANEQLVDMAHELRRIGESVPTDAIYAAARVANTKKVILNSPQVDVMPEDDEVAFCSDIRVAMEVIND